MAPTLLIFSEDSDNSDYSEYSEYSDYSDYSEYSDQSDYSDTPLYKKHPRGKHRYDTCPVGFI